ncbi:hypothetical protein [Mesorhizobium sp. YM1C-6-2]|uniref:hypothetical protein n=1 Tax=Mesorhizobium sp. YM1C-6-2 TaxID=1827501 RepID=UPI000EF1BD6D|nr:hypothetical protein [Mesorhizobium sp. YM1C-6-2]RLP22269.1 hypothetical protein D8676_25365 [Mesorhizobium sp. YM1C-6-2]
MAYIHPDVLDNGLAVLTADVDTLHYCSAEPTSYATAVSLSLGSKSTPTVGSPTAASPKGRRVIVSAVVDGAATGTGNITHWALVDAGASKLLAVGALVEPMAVAAADVITSEAFSVVGPGA